MSDFNIDEAMPNAPQAVKDAVSDAVAKAQVEAEARRDMAQDLIDEGYQIVSAGQEEDGSHYLLVKKEGEKAEQKVAIDLEKRKARFVR